LLVDTDTRKSIERFKSKLLGTWEKLRNFTTQILNDPSGIYVSEKKWLPHVHLSLIKWAFCVISSRSYDTHNHGECIILPVGDLFNHSPNYDNVAWRQHNKPKWEWVSNSKISPGMEIAISYGNKTNLELMKKYGFVLPNNDRSNLEFPRSSNVSEANLHNMIFNMVQARLSSGLSKKKKKRRNFSSRDTVLLNHGVVNNADLNYLRILFLKKDEFSSYTISHVISNNFWSKENESKVWQYLAQKVTEKIEDIPGNFEQDQHILSELRVKKSNSKSLHVQYHLDRKILLVEFRMDKRKFLEELVASFHKKSV